MMSVDFMDQKEAALALAETVRVDLVGALTETALARFADFDLSDDAAKAAAQAMASAELSLALGGGVAEALVAPEDLGAAEAWNAEIGAQIAAYAAEEGLGEVALESLVVDALETGLLAIGNVPEGDVPLWAGPSETWQNLARPVGDTDPPGGTGIKPVYDEAAHPVIGDTSLVLDAMAEDFFVFFETSLAESGGESDFVDFEGLRSVADHWAQTVWVACAEEGAISETFWADLIEPFSSVVSGALEG
ncbi:hypothetical protein SAMN05877809_102534 [Rhodobacter sp. JA431]|nr:hypothetical protein SAMN05877809_102534 [Rhodobacter sp. JA431]